MKRYPIAIFALLLIPSIMFAWKPAGDKIKTKWAEGINVNNVLPEYPRPIMERQDWSNLNGLWEYAITSVKDVPTKYEGEILVPYAIESSLSGVGKHLNENQSLWYKRNFNISPKWTGKKVILHFGAVDWKADVWVNNIKVGEHTGGFTPFSLDITAALAKGENELVVKVWDPTDKGTQPRGKQVSKPEGIWYTPVTGIWQTVWIEPVAQQYITNVKTTPDIDNNTLSFSVSTNEYIDKGKIDVKVLEGKSVIAQGASINNNIIEVPMPQGAKLWSPSSPFLYDLEITLSINGKVIDSINSYAAMRKISAKRDNDGIMRIQLNNKDLFQFGPLDQGWWPDGLYTAPSDEALAYDVKKTKDFGFNMIRKHIKVEPARWYTHCDKIGIIVWQDMPSGDTNPEWQNKKYFEGTEKCRSSQSEATYKKEWKEIIDCLYSYPCIGVWVPFNEAWGQFKTPEIAKWTKDYDPSRLVNPASGGNHYTCGDMLDLHNYPGPDMYLYDAQRVNVLGEYGGIGLVLKGHIWEPKRNWGYVQFNSSQEVTAEYAKYANQLKTLIARGFSAAVYTQTTDVEVEVNGLMTYDRNVIKIDEAKVKSINESICNSLNK
ncbi:MAG: glycoside hydrolase family 2 TIM barrel-domain containing protein [Muribaculaceae bacterium]